MGAQAKKERKDSPGKGSRPRKRSPAPPKESKESPRPGRSPELGRSTPERSPRPGTGMSATQSQNLSRTTGAGRRTAFGERFERYQMDFEGRRPRTPPDGFATWGSLPNPSNTTLLPAKTTADQTFKM